MHMFRGILLGVLAAAALSAVPVAREQREATERHVYVRVTDARDALVPGLTPADFVVREDGLAREVVRVSIAPPPTHLSILADNTAEAQSLLTELRSGLLSFVRTMAQLPAPPAMTLLTLAERPTRIVDFTTSDIALENGVKGIFPRPGSGSYFLDAVVEASQTLRKAGAARPVIIAFVMDASPEFSERLHTNVADALKDARASLWTVQLQRQQPPVSLDARERASVVNEVTLWSGGANKPVLSRPAIQKGFADIAAAMLSRYDITYGRPASLVPPERITVEARDRSLRVMAPRWAVE